MNMNFKNNIDGQLTIPGLLILFLVLMVLANIMPQILSNVGTLSSLLTAASFTTEAAMTNLIPLFLIAVFLSTVAMYGGPQIR